MSNAATSRRGTHKGLVLGVDGGGSKTLAWLVDRDAESNSPLGSGQAGPSNPQAVGIEPAGANIRQAVQAAFLAAGQHPAPVASACLALAGVGREPIRQAMQDWCQSAQLADQVRVVHDAMAVLAAGAPAGWGVALITGTGSFAFGSAPDGSWQRTGGWGFLFGDEGSGYAIGLAALKAISRAADRRGPPTSLTDHILAHLQLQQTADLIPCLCRPRVPRPLIASLAERVFQAADQGDQVATTILDQAADDLADLVRAVVDNLSWPTDQWPLVIAGSVLVRQPSLEHRLATKLRAHGCSPDSIRRVTQPVIGAVRLALR